MLALGAAAATMPTLAMSEPSGLTASVTLFPKTKHRKVNPNAMGIGLWRPPFTETLGVFKEWFFRTSCRLWILPDASAWEQQIPVLQELQPSMILMLLAVESKYNARYKSKEDNNLPPLQQVTSVVKRLGDICTVLARNNIQPPDGLYWEAWNEPGYENGGKWEPEDLARYVNDLSMAIQEHGLPVKVLAPLNQDFDERTIHWNETYCSRLDAALVGGLVTHYYSHHWSLLAIPADEFQRRAGYAGIMQARVRQDMSYVTRFGHGNWGLHCSEWNIHPPGVATSQKFYASRDMAAALFVFDTVKIFIGEGMASAQFFHLLNDWVTSHFAVLTRTHAGENFIHPTGALFGLFHQYLDGHLFKVETDSPSYERASDYPLIPAFQVPYIEALAAISSTGRRSLFLSNKHSEDMNIKLYGDNIPAGTYGVLLQGSGGKNDSALLSEMKVTLAGKSIKLPGSSIMVLSWMPV